MKKLKALKGALIGVFVVAAACCVFAACGSSDDDEEEKNEAAVQSSPISVMALSVDNAKRTYLTYQSFSSEGIEATVTRENGETEDVVANDLVVDYSGFNNSQAGEYDIVVTYTEDGVTLEESYKVEVIEEIVGMTIEKGTVDYDISPTTNDDGDDDDDNNEGSVVAEPIGATIDLSDMKVYAVDVNGVATSEMSNGAYELAFYKGGEQITSLDNLSAGVYTIYAYREVTVAGKYSTIGYECGAYVLCYVVDTLAGIEFVNGTTSQEMSVTDSMTGTWTYTLTYGSGLTRTLTSDDVSVTGVNTLSGTGGEGSAEAGATATVTYTETMVSSNSRESLSVSCSVTYHISAPEGNVVYSYSLDLNSIVTASGMTAQDSTGVELNSGYFTGNNTFLSYTHTSTNNKIRWQSSAYCIETNGEALSVTFMGTGSITISFSSNGSNPNYSNIGLKNGNGYYLKASEMNGVTEGENKILNEYEMENGTGYTYEVKNTTAVSVTFTVEEPGSYIIATNIQEFSDWTGSFDRVTRIRTIEMIDIYDSSASTGGASLGEATSLKTDVGDLPLAETLNLESIDLTQPQSFATIFGANNSKKN